MSITSEDLDYIIDDDSGATSAKHLHPYVVGATFVLRRHEPPAPFGGAYAETSECTVKNTSDYSQLDWILSHPPVSGVVLAEEKYIKIAKAIRTGNDCGAQLFLTGARMAAKVYDPLYYVATDFERAMMMMDVSQRADSKYTCESAAYLETVGKGVQGTIMPRYYGSWTMALRHRLGEAIVERDVRVILIEHIAGVRMCDLQPNSILQEEHENIMFKLIEAEYDLRSAGVCHEDANPWNVILALASSYAGPDLRVTLIDYGLSRVYRVLGFDSHPRVLHNPCFEWPCASMWSSWGWLPHGNDCTEWVWKCWGSAQDGKYVPVERDPNSDMGYPKRPRRETSNLRGDWMITSCY